MLDITFRNLQSFPIIAEMINLVQPLEALPYVYNLRVTLQQMTLKTFREAISSNIAKTTGNLQLRLYNISKT